ncbi:hypothetical protein C8F01DRAFT_1132894 [Mycena amicta]|nr:hypothetical protein C8F01DRAFT_1132894 [Mycena amicta]
MCVRCLPIEILAAVFQLRTSTEGCHCLIVYGAVSRHWRDAILEYPDLWTNIHPFIMRKSIPWTSLCLDRSKSCLFDVVLHLPEPLDMPIVSKIMLLVVQHVQRLRSLSILAADSLQINPGEIFALLENAQRAPRPVSIDMTTPRDGILIHTPSLSTLRLHGYMVTASPLLQELILPKLRLLVDTSFNPCHGLLPLLDLPNVEYLELVGTVIPDLSTTFRPHAFSKLRTLRLVGLTIVSRNSEVDNASYLRSLSTIEELHLIHSYAEYLSWRFPALHGPHFAPPRAQSDGPAVADLYPNLRCVCLDTLLAKDALWLYTFTMERPKIEMVKLSRGIDRHFSHSLGLRPDGGLQTLHWRSVDGAESNPVDAGVLLRERVQVEQLDTDGLIPWRGP